MAYKRPYRSSSWSNYSYSGPTKVYIHWSQKSSAYSIKFSDTKHWNEMQILITFIKNLPTGEKDVQMEEDINTGKKNWTWFITEKYVEPFKEMVRNMSGVFEIDFVDKPVGGGGFQAHFISTETLFTKFKEITGTDISALEYDAAKKVYRRWIMKNHPDVGGDPVKASSVNECWTNLETLHFKTRKETEYANN